jgi:rhodanese-related sulfurtransferase
MKRGHWIITVLVLLVALSACKQKNSTVTATPDSASKPVAVGSETAMLLKDLDTKGDYVNSQEFPSLIKASLVHDNQDAKMLVVDLRPSAAYKKGHIAKAVNKDFKDLPEYFESGIKPFEYDKIVLVSEDGQVASYATCLLRLMGYGNVFAMRWGMSAWNRKLADEGWLKAVSGKYSGQLETTDHPMPPATGMPALKTGKSTAEEISTERFKQVFSQGADDVLVTADQVFADPQKYYVINYDRKDKYENGHIPGAIRYKPDGTLGIVSAMATIPEDKPVLVYCATGHNSGFVTAYLRLFGYDAHTLSYGNNGFMYDKMQAQKTALSWLPFTESEVHDYPLVK